MPGDGNLVQWPSGHKPTTNSTGSGQVLQCPYIIKARLIVQEMTDRLVLDLVDKGLVTDQIVLTIGYDIENLKDPDRRRLYKGEVVTDRYGRRIPSMPMALPIFHAGLLPRC